MQGGQSSIEVGIAVGVVSTIFGLLWGAVAGYFGGGLDGVLMRLVDIGLAIPVVFLFIFMAQVYKPSIGLLIFLLAIVSSPSHEKGNVFVGSMDDTTPLPSTWSGGATAAGIERGCA